MNPFECALPVLQTDIDKILIESRDGYEGSFKIRNVGGGLLEGEIFSNSNLLSFSPQSFKDVTSEPIIIHYSLNMDFFREGDVIHTECVITGNGGERIIPAIIKITKGVLGEMKISDLKGFAAYAKKNPIEARSLFTSHEFMMWLFDIGYEPMNVYEKFIKDANKERAMEKFLLFNKLKNRVSLEFEELSKSITVTPFEREHKQAIAIRKIGWGYTECTLVSTRPWLRLDPEKLTKASFDDEGTAYVMLIVDAIGLSKSNDAKVVISENNFLNLHVKKLPLIKLSIDREAYSSNDKGLIVVENLSGIDSFIEVSTDENFLKLDAKRYPLQKTTQIPFTVKLSALQSMQMSFAKQPFFTGNITVKTTINYIPVKKSISVKVW